MEAVLVAVLYPGLAGISHFGVSHLFLGPQDSDQYPGCTTHLSARALPFPTEYRSGKTPEKRRLTYPMENSGTHEVLSSWCHVAQSLVPHSITCFVIFVQDLCIRNGHLDSAMWRQQFGALVWAEQVHWMVTMGDELVAAVKV